MTAIVGLVDRIAEIRARAAAATPGPWYDAQIHLGGAHHEAVLTGRDRFPIIAVTGFVGTHQDSQPDAVFIAHAREDVDWLLSEVERLRVELQQLRTELEAASVHSCESRCALDHYEEGP